MQMVPAVSQALYTWSAHAIDSGGSGGFGFVAVSPSLDDRLDWLRHTTKLLTQFAPGMNILDRKEYRPIGRHLDRDQALLYRKVDAGNDGYGRPGRYLVHFLIGAKNQLTLSTLWRLEIASTIWLQAADVPLDRKVLLDDLPLEKVRPPRRYFSLTPEEEERAITGARQIASRGFVDVTALSPMECLGVMYCLPTWMDVNAALTSDWHERGGETVTVTITERGPAGNAPDQRAAFTSRNLDIVRDELSHSGFAEGDTVRSKVKSKSPFRSGKRQVPRPAPSHVAATETELGETIRVWARKGARELSLYEKRMITENAHEALSALARLGATLPRGDNGRGWDELAVTLLQKCDDPQQWELVSAVIPSSRTEVEEICRLTPIPSVFLAAIALNGRPDTRILPPTSRLTDDTINAILDIARGDPRIADALAATLRISFHEKAPFFHALLAGGDVDYGWVYETLMPEAFGGEYAALVKAVAFDPCRFVAWLRVPPAYRDGLTALLRKEARRGRRRGFRNW